ncbi:MAG: TM2 domain-containing protein [Nannocystales bacterium]
MRSLTVSYLLAALGFLGVSGVHRFYLGKPVTGIIWFLTGGLFMLGTIYDLITMESQVRESNRYALPAGQAMLPPGGAPYAGGYPPHQAYPPNPGYPPPGPAYAPPQDPNADLRDPTVDLELRVLKLARLRSGRLTAASTAAELAIPVSEADAKLTEIAKAGHANVDITDEGAVVYDFPALRV